VGDDQLAPRTLVAAILVVAAIVLIQRATARPRAAPRPTGAELGIVVSAPRPGQLRSGA
jgi:hypothetical protein